MNNLQKMAKKKEYKKALVGKLKGAYHAAAKEGDKVMKKADKMKTANPAKVKALMAKGMGAKEAVKAAYPDWPDDKVAALAAKMGGMGKEAKAGFSKKHDDSAHLTGKQKNLPDFIQKKIVAKKAKEPVKKEMMDKEASMAAAGKMLARGFSGLKTIAKSPKEALQALKQSVKTQGVKGTIKGNKDELAALGTALAGTAVAKKALSSDAA